MLAQLENKGISLDVVYELSKVLDLQKIAAELALRTTPFPNNISVNNGNDNSKYQKNTQNLNGTGDVNKNSDTNTNHSAELSIRTDPWSTQSVNNGNNGYPVNNGHNPLPDQNLLSQQ